MLSDWDYFDPTNPETFPEGQYPSEGETQPPPVDQWDPSQWIDPYAASSGSEQAAIEDPPQSQSYNDYWFGFQGDTNTDYQSEPPAPAPTSIPYSQDYNDYQFGDDTSMDFAQPPPPPAPEPLVQYDKPSIPIPYSLSQDYNDYQFGDDAPIDLSQAPSPSALGTAIGKLVRDEYEKDIPAGEKGINIVLGSVGEVVGSVSKTVSGLQESKLSKEQQEELDQVDPNGIIQALNEQGFDETTSIGQTARALANPNKSTVGKVGSVAGTAIDLTLGELARQVEKGVGYARAYIPRNVDDEKIDAFGQYSNSLGLIGELSKLNMPVALATATAKNVRQTVRDLADPNKSATEKVGSVVGTAFGTIGEILKPAIGLSTAVGRGLMGEAPSPPSNMRRLSDDVAGLVEYADAQGYLSRHYLEDHGLSEADLSDRFKAHPRKVDWVLLETAEKGYSSYNAQYEIAQRIAFGEKPDIAKSGLQGPDKTSLLIDKESWAMAVQDRIEAVGRIAEYDGRKKNLTASDIAYQVNEAKRLEAQKIAHTNSIGGSENVAAEFVGQVLFDPTNYLGGLGLADDVVKRMSGRKLAQDLLKAEREIGPLVEGAEHLATKEVLIEQAIKGMPETFVRAAQDLRSENALLKEAGKSSAIKDLLEDGFDAVEAIVGYTPRTQASTKADHASSILIQFSLPQNSDNAAEVVSYVSQVVGKNEGLWKDGKLIDDVFGEVARSPKMQIAKEIFEKSYTDLVQVAVKAETQDGFMRQEFLTKAFDILSEAAKTTVPGALKAETKFQEARELAAATVTLMKQGMSKVFLNNPGAVIRNAGGDTFGMAIDDLIRESGGMKTTDYLAYFGGSERVVSSAQDAIRAKYSFAQELKSGGKSFVHKLTDGIMEKGSEWEQQRYQHAFVAAHEQFMRSQLKYSIADAIRSGVPEELIQKILSKANESNLAPSDIAKDIRAMGKGQWTSPAIHEMAGVTADEIRKTLDTGDISDIRRVYEDGVKSGKSKADIAKDLDELVAQRKSRTAVVGATYGTSNTPVTNRAVDSATDVNHNIAQVVGVAKASEADPAEAGRLASAIKSQRDAADKGFKDVLDQATKADKTIAPKVFAAMLDEEAAHYDEYYKAQLAAHETAIRKASEAGNDKVAKSAAWKGYYAESEAAARKLSENINAVHQTYSDAMKVGDIASIPTPKNSFADSYVRMMNEIKELGENGASAGDLRLSLLSGRTAMLESKSGLVDVASKAVEQVNDPEFTHRAFTHIKNAETDSAKIFEKAAGQRTIINSQVTNGYISAADGNTQKARVWQTAMREGKDRIEAAREAIQAEMRLAGNWKGELGKLGYSEARIAIFEQQAKSGVGIVDLNKILRDKIHAAESPVSRLPTHASLQERRQEINRLAISRGNATYTRDGTAVMNEQRVLNSINAHREPFTNEFKSLEEAYGIRYDEAVKALSAEKSAFAQADFLHRQQMALQKEIDVLTAQVGTGAITPDLASKIAQRDDLAKEVARLDKLASDFPSLTTADFERQLAMSFRLSKEEADAAIALVKARADAKGVTYEKYVADTFASVRKSDQRSLVSSMNRTGIPSHEITYPDGVTKILKASDISETELDILRSSGANVVTHPNGVFEYDGLIEPRLLYQYAGEKAQLSNEQLQGLAKAKAMFEEGRDPEEIRFATGWFLGPDKKIRYEIPDINARVNYDKLPASLSKKGFKTTLGEIYDHEELYTAYPFLRDRTIEFRPPRPDGVMGVNDAKGITLYTASPRSRSPEGAAWQSTLVHEIQHSIQRKEGFASGGSMQAMQGYYDNLFAEHTLASESALKKIGLDYDDYLSGRLSKAEMNLADATLLKDKTIKSLDKQIAEYEKKSGGDPYKAYQMLAGEVEARDVSRRIAFDADKRLEVGPYSIENISPKKMFVLGVDEGTDEARVAAKAAVTFNPEDGRAIVYALKQPTVESFAHEVGHVFRRELTESQMEVAGKWAGVGEHGVWNTANEEKFANGFVEYLRLGNAPTPELTNVFEKFKNWITSLWKNLTGDVLPENMKSLYGELLTPVTKIAPDTVAAPSISRKVESAINPKLAEIRFKNAQELISKNPENLLAQTEFIEATRNLEKAKAAEKIDDLNKRISDLGTKINTSPMSDTSGLVARQKQLQDEIDSILSKYPEGIKAQPRPVSHAGTSPDAFIAQNANAQVHGAGDPPMRHEVDSIKAKAFEDVVTKIKNNLPTMPDLPSPEIVGWDKTSQKIINHLQSQWNETNARAIADATARADFALLDYSKQRGADAFVQLVAPYAFWPTRQARNYTARLMQDPQIIEHWLRFQDFEKKLNEQRGMNKSFQGKYSLNELSGGMINGKYANNLYFAPLSGLVPLGDIFRTNVYDPERERSSFQTIYDTASMLGIGANPFLDAAIRGSSLAVRTTDADGRPLSKEEIEKESANYGPESLGYYWPFGSALSGITSISGMNDGTGLNLERTLLKALGVQPRLQESKLISAGISSYSFENQKNANYDPRYGVLAQAIHERNKDSYTKIDELMYGNTLDMSKRLASEMQTSRKDAEIALLIFREGVRRAAQERGTSRLFSWATGMSSKFISDGTKMQDEARKLESGSAYNDATKTGSRAAMEKARELNPAGVVARAQFATYPGDKKDPLEQWEWMEKQRIVTQFGVVKDEFIKKNPADRKGAKAIDTAMWKEWSKIGADKVESPEAQDWTASLDALKGQLNQSQKLPSSTAATIVYAPKSIYGASPAETVEIRKGEILKAYGEKRPTPESFIDSQGDINYNAYNNAVAEWSKNVKDKIMLDGTTKAVLAQAEKDGSGIYKSLNEWLGGNLDADLKNYKAKYDSPVEAAQAVWFKNVYDKAFADYNVLRGQKDPRAYEKTVGAIEAMDSAALAKLVKENYPGMWSDDFIADQIKGMKMPSGKDVSRLSMSKDKTEIEDALTSFKETLAGKIPVGRAYDEMMKGNPLIAGVNAAIYNPDLKKKITPEMIAQAQIMIAGYAAANRIVPNPVEWAEAKRLVDDRNQTMADRYGDKWKEEVDKYFALDAKGRASAVKANSNLANMLKDYSSLKDNPLYVKYYSTATKGESASTLGSPSGTANTKASNQTVDRSVQSSFWDSYGKLSQSEKTSLLKSSPMLGKIVNPETRLSVQPEMWSYYVKLMNGGISREDLDKLVDSTQTDRQAKSVFWDEYQRTSPQIRRAAFQYPQVMKVVNGETRDGSSKEDFQTAYKVLREANASYTKSKQTGSTKAVSQPKQASAPKQATVAAPQTTTSKQAPQKTQVQKTVIAPANLAESGTLQNAFDKMYKSIPPSTLAGMVKDRPIINKAIQTKSNDDYAAAIAAMEKWSPNSTKTSSLPRPTLNRGGGGGTPARSTGGSKPSRGNRPPRGKRGPNTNLKKVISPYK